MFRTTFSATLAALLALVCTVPVAVAGDNSHILIIDRQHRSSPFGDHESRRRTEVYGPSTGFRYEEYRTPIQPVYPYPRYGYGGHGHGRVIHHDGGGYLPYGAPVAPRLGRTDAGHRHDRYADERNPDRDRRHGAGRRDFDAHRRGPQARDDYRDRRPHSNRAIRQPTRAIEPARRAIRD